MDRTAIKIFAFTFFIILHNAYALDMPVKDPEAEVYIKQEYNRGFEYCWDLSAVGSVTLFERLALRGGLSYGRLGEQTGEIKAFAKAGIVPFAKRPWWRISARYVYNDLTDYDIRAHSVLAIASYEFFRYRAGITFGPNFRFTSFFGEPAIFESIISYTWYYEFINNNRWRLRATFGNYDDFNASLGFSMGSSSMWLDSDVYLSENWTLVGNMKFMQRGNEPFSSNFYGIAWQGGARYSW